MSETGELPGETTERLGYSEWAAALRDGELLGQECPECDHVTAAPKAACARCGSRDIATVPLPTEGEVYSETTIAVPPEGFNGEYQLALVELGEARVLGRINGTVEIGDVVTFDEVITVDEYPALVFVPAE